MDPVVTLAAMRDFDHESWDSRWENAHALRGWLVSGGFVPAGESRLDLIAECDSVCVAAAGIIARWAQAREALNP